ncbi:hypothetical protein ACSFA8_20870 [Variovorax sp. RT4R15]|uniref:hypothetical protein n=1 Tax=Variovorax sp. RT4R15 TaxID=3443737 RepID=UPI003F479CA4
MTNPDLQPLAGALEAAPHDHEWRQHPVTKEMICRYCGIPRPVRSLVGLSTLRNVIETLRATGSYSDEEGEATNHLADLADSLSAPTPQQGAPEAVLPHDVVVGHATFRKGVKLSTFILAAQGWHRVAYADVYALTAEQKAENFRRLTTPQPSEASAAPVQGWMKCARTVIDVHRSGQVKDYRAAHEAAVTLLETMLAAPQPVEAPREWTPGEPPRDGATYEMRCLCKLDGHSWVAWQSNGWWNGEKFVRRNQFRGGTDALLLCSHWRLPEQEAGGIGAEVLHRMKYHANIDGEGDWELFPLDADECKDCFEVLIVRATPATAPMQAHEPTPAALTDPQLVEHLHARGWRVDLTDAPMLREAAAALGGAPAGDVSDAVISGYSLLVSEKRFADEILIQRARQIDGPALWAVRLNGDCLNRNGLWEWEPMPSGRDDEYLARCRFDSATDAIAAARAALRNGGRL